MHPHTRTHTRRMRVPLPARSQVTRNSSLLMILTNAPIVVVQPTLSLLPSPSTPHGSLTAQNLVENSSFENLCSIMFRSDSDLSARELQNLVGVCFQGWNEPRWTARQEVSTADAARPPSVHTLNVCVCAAWCGHPPSLPHPTARVAQIPRFWTLSSFFPPTYFHFLTCQQCSNDVVWV
jgi:hypothetical protein